MRLFVAQIPDKVNGMVLESLFARFGEVEFARVVYDKHTGKSKHYGFVEMPHDEEAKNLAYLITQDVNGDLQGQIASCSQYRESRSILKGSDIHRDIIMYYHIIPLIGLRAAQPQFSESALCIIHRRLPVRIEDPVAWIIAYPRHVHPVAPV